MQFLTDEECQAWMRPDHAGEDGWPTLKGAERLEAKGKIGFNYGSALRLSSLFEYDDECLLWVTQTRVWNTNLQLYYRFRESYGDRRLVETAPGHLFLHYEKADFLSFLQIGVWNGWDMWLLGSHDYGRLFVSHDEFYLASVVTKDLIDALQAP